MKGAKTGLFIVELMISLLMFSFCAAVCLQLFLAARVRTDRARDMSRAVNIVSGAAEAYKTSADFGVWDGIYPGGVEPVDAWGVEGARVLFGKNWELLESGDEAGAAYVLTGYFLGGGSAGIGISYYGQDKPGDMIFELTVKAVDTRAGQ